MNKTSNVNFYTKIILEIVNLNKNTFPLNNYVEILIVFQISLWILDLKIRTQDKNCKVST